MKNILILTTFLLLFGCSSTGLVNINGHYFIMGDENCKKYTVISNTRIMCHDDNGIQTGWRNAETNEEMRMHRHREMMEQQRRNNSSSQTCYMVGGFLRCF